MADRRRRKVSSLTARVLTISSVWAVIALVAIGIIITTLYRQGTERGFREVLRAQLYNVVNSVWINREGRLRGEPQFGDLRYSQPQTGWYWIVDPLDGEEQRRLASVSIGGRELEVPSVSEVPFNALYERFYEMEDPFGNEILVVETEVELNDEGRAARFRVTGNHSAVDDDVAAFTQRLVVALIIFGLGSLAANVGGILIGLKPLDSVRRSLENIRNGKSTSLEGEFPREIAPLAGEVNALIETNRRVVDRARMQVGNLAHSLKTPLAVLLNESREMKKEHQVLVSGQVKTMQNQVQTYLDRARIVAQKGSILARVKARPALDRLIRVMQRLNPDLDFRLVITPDGSWLAMEQQDLEEIVGNLLDNAAKFARRTVRVTLTQAEVPPEAKVNPTSEGLWMLLSVEDDGPGLDDGEIVEAMKRGRRLDESKPGTGLGLSIVLEVAREYHGAVALDRSQLGGLRAAVTLPALRKDIVA
ncbi:ATP-binding protein [Pararhizobium haloflavum]|uniref:ATP-binding protein n=1 Tax=Pararhizobium haloflavum TaxID=2037914 RepID=UPI000C183B45|nr:ATP-binding protein [Pararhizobium haloflavum]